jgi:hypothetical protein
MPTHRPSSAAHLVIAAGSCEPEGRAVPLPSGRSAGYRALGGISPEPRAINVVGSTSRRDGPR